MKFLTWQNPEQLIVAQVLIKNLNYSVAEIRFNSVMRYKILSIFAIVFIFTCCNRYIDHFKIEGYWRIIKADDSSKGTVICISKEKDVYVGRIYKKNDNKYVK
ncbi:hypothetical protein, partial [Segatella hominis]|uniref:hypothetical protein n=1 Tax=Segatella hominis TaxID=2518605 RepID=UPI003AB9AFDF